MSVLAPNLLLFGFVALVIVIFVAVWISRGGSHSAPALAKRECSACKRWMARDTSVCPNCSAPNEPWTFRDGRWWVVRADASYYLDEPSQTWVRFDPSISPPPPG
jgi:hypothetical protein